MRTDEQRTEQRLEMTDDLTTGPSPAAVTPEAATPPADSLRERICAEMVREDPERALRAEVVLALTAGHSGDVRGAVQTIRRRGVDPQADTPTLLPAAGFVNRHRAVLDSRIEQEMRERGYTGRLNYLAAMRLDRAVERHSAEAPHAVRDLETVLRDWTRYAGPDLPDTDHNLLRYAVEQTVEAIDGVAVRELRAAYSMYERAQDRVLVAEWSDALESGEVSLTPQAYERDRVGESSREFTNDLDGDAALEQEAL